MLLHLEGATNVYDRNVLLLLTHDDGGVIHGCQILHDDLCGYSFLPFPFPFFSKGGFSDFVFGDKRRT